MTNIFSRVRTLTAVAAATATLSLTAGALAAPALAAPTQAHHTTSTRAASARVARVAAVRVAVPTSPSNGYTWINYYRALAGETPLTRNTTLETANATHIRYLANHSLPCETDVHTELTTRVNGCGPNPTATTTGKNAAANSVITRTTNPSTDQQAVTDWFNSAFHALTLLDPRLQQTGYAAYYTPTPTGATPNAWNFTAAADVYHARTGTYNHHTIAFPAPGTTTPLLSYQIGTESPDPFTTANPGTCTNFTTHTTISAPTIIQWPTTTGVPTGTPTITDLTTHTPQPTCALTATNYPTGSLPNQFLNGTNGITKTGLYYTNNPYTPGHTYQLTINHHTITTFTTK